MSHTALTLVTHGTRLFYPCPKLSAMKFRQISCNKLHKNPHWRVSEKILTELK